MVCASTKVAPPRIIYYIYYDDLETLGPYLYSIRMWRDRGYGVSVFSLAKPDCYQALPKEFRSSFVHHTVEIPPWVKMGALGLQGLGFAAHRIFRVKTKSGEWSKLLKMVFFAFSCLKRTSLLNECILIAVDAPGLWAAALASKKFGYPYVYFVKEIFLSGDVRNMFDRIAKLLERKANRGALYTVEFDDVRSALLRKDNCLKSNAMLTVPNAPVGQPTPERSDYFRDMFQIPRNQKIVLYTGGIADYNLTFEHVRSVNNWPENAVLVMHLKGKPIDLEKLKILAKNARRDVYFSTELLPFDEIHKIYRSCDIGLALYGDQTLNHQYAGLSSGKMFNFMKACVPIVTNDTPACRRAIEETGCGVCIGNISQLGDAIKTILANEERFINNCRETFPKVSYERHHGKFIDAVERAIGIDKNKIVN